jgi:hypothetical protein
MKPLRCGSILLFCMAVLATTAILAFTMVRALGGQRNANQDAGMMLLARGAALSGAQHAFNQILQEHISEPFSRIDGPARGPFVPHFMPYSLNGLIDNPSEDADGDGTLDSGEDLNGNGVLDPPPVALGADDVPQSYHVMAPLFAYWWAGWNWSNNHIHSYMWDGRGRYYDVNVWSRTPTGGSTASPSTRFGAVLDASGSLPQVTDGVYYDRNLASVPGTQKAAREESRYRARYAVGVVDLDGQLPFTGDPAVPYTDITTYDPASAPNSAAARIVRHQWAFQRLIHGWMRGQDADDVAPFRAMHMWQGRGYPGNYDRRPATATGHAPVTFPLMYRASRLNTGETNDGNSAWYRYRGWVWGPNASPSSPTVYGDVGIYRHAQNLYCFLDDNQGTGGAIGGKRDGGELLMSHGKNNTLSGAETRADKWDGLDGTYTHSLIGAPFSFFGIERSCAGSLGSHGERSTSWWTDGALGQNDSARVGFTPFGRGITHGATNSRYTTAPPVVGTASIDTPFSINLMTCAPRTIQAMLNAYLPPGVVRASLSHKTDSSKNVKLLLFGEPNLYIKELHPAFDLENASGVKPYIGPTSNAGNAAKEVSPDLNLTNVRNVDTGTAGAYDPGDQLGWRAPRDRYPGALAFNGYDTTTPLGSPLNDKLGRSLDVNAKAGRRPNGAQDPYLNWPFYSRREVQPSNYCQMLEARFVAGKLSDSAIASTAYTGGSTGNWNNYYIEPDNESIWADIVAAFCNALGVARGQHAQINSANFNPATGFNNAAWVGTKVTTVQQFDALFLRCLGASVDDSLVGAESSTAATGWFQDVWGCKFYSATASYSIKGLEATITADPTNFPTTVLGHTVTAANYTQAIELIVNDFRLSFLGSHPSYLANFRPLDFNGDNKIACSGYPPNAAASSMEKDLGISEYVTIAGPIASPTTQIPAVTQPFCISGNLFIGKSRFWRVVVRGEVWDNLLKRKVTESTLDSVLCVDPADETKEMTGAASAPTKQYSTHVIYQRWHWDKMQGYMGRSY